MELEPVQNARTNESNPVATNPLFAELQLKRENRRASDRALQVQNSNNGGALGENQLVVSDDLHHHLQNSNQDEEQQNSSLENSNPEDTLRPQHPTSRGLGSGLLSYLQNLGNPFRRPRLPSPPTQQESIPQSLPMYIDPFPRSIFEDLHQHHQNPVNEMPEITNSEAPQNTEAQPESPEDILGNTFNMFPHGALIVRTVTPGPDGAVMVRMRVIPMDGLFSEHDENEGPSPIALFGALVRLLSGTSMMERGLEKEALESLPVVTYDTEAFKHVDPESKRCTICFDDYEDGHELKYLWCLHRFHKNCVDHWLENHTTCPVCKKDYADAQKQSFE